jgi:hypothetical protein
MTPKLVIIDVLAGIALGLRYKVLILIRAVVLVILFTLIVGIARGDGFPSIVLAVAIAGAGIQVGYLVGAQIRALVG